MLSQFYYIRSWKKFNFIITPNELRSVLYALHHVSCNGVRKGYVESSPDEFLSKYELLYNKLTHGERLVQKQDWILTSASTGITGNLGNCLYNATNRLSVPNFLEPCILLDTFCFYLYEDQLSTSSDPSQSPENIVGLCVSFPSKVEFVQATEKRNLGVFPANMLDDYEIYQQVISQIKAITNPLKLQINGKQYRPSVRVSAEAKKDLPNFYFITENSATIL